MESKIEKDQPKEPQTKKWRYLLLDYFTDIIQYEQNLDSLHQSLNQQNNFSCLNLFYNLDNDNKGYIGLGDIINFLSSHSIEFEEKYIRLFIRFYDKNNDFVLNFDEFKAIISDYGNYKDKNDNNNQELGENIISIFCDILVQEIELCKRCDENIKKCLDSRHFTIYEGFVEIAEEEEYITEENFAKYLDEYGIKLDEKIIKKMIYRLDSDNDGKISFVEFNNIFFPPNYNDDKKYNEYKYNINDYNINNNNINNNININKSSNLQNITQIKTRNDDNYKYNNDNNTYNSNLDFKYRFSKNPRLNYTSSVLNYNYSKYPDTEIEKYKLNKEYNSLKNSRENINPNDSISSNCPINHVFIHCNCCCYCGCKLCCN